MATTDDTSVRRLLDFIVEKVEPRRVILFGSRARGDAHRDSDYDLLIVKDETPERRSTRGERLGQLHVEMVDETFPAADLLLYGYPDYEYRRTGSNNVVARAEREGVVLYDRPGGGQGDAGGDGRPCW